MKTTLAYKIASITAAYVTKDENGGDIAFQSYNIAETEKSIHQLLASL